MAKHNTLRQLYQLKAFPMWLFIAIGILAFGSFCITVYFLICGLPQKSADTDLMGVIVSVLSILITLLVAWQIYMTIVSKEQVKELSTEINSIRQDYNALNQQNRNITIGWHRLTIGDMSLDADDYVDAYNQYIQALKLFINSSLQLDDQLVKACISSMMACVDMVEEAENERQLNFKERFINNNPKFDKENDLLFELVNKREHVYRNFKKDLIYLKERRNALKRGYTPPAPVSDSEDDYMSMAEFDAELEKKLNQRESE